MIIILKKSNVLLISLIFILLAAIYSLNTGLGEAKPVTSRHAQKTVMLDPGHGGEDPGAVSDYSKISEKDINLGIAKNVRQLLEGQGYKVIMTRQEDILEYTPDTRNIVQKRKQDLLRRKKLMDEGGADVVVSIHLNKFPQTQYFGAQTFFPPQSDESKKLAESIQKSLKENVDPRNERQSLVKKEQIIILKNFRTPTVIVECGFLSNVEEEKKLATPEYQDKIANAIAAGIVGYFK